MVGEDFRFWSDWLPGFGVFFLNRRLLVFFSPPKVVLSGCYCMANAVKRYVLAGVCEVKSW